MSQKKQGFVFGTLILILSTVIVKVVGALYKVPLTNGIGDTAMGYFNQAYQIYAFCFLISTTGLPVAISRMIATAQARKQKKEVDKIYRVSLLIFAVIGLAGTCLLFFGAPFISSNISKTPELEVCIRTISPIMFFVCIVACIRGYFQGRQNMIPTAASQVIEVMGNLLLGLSFGMYANRKGMPAPTVAAFALGGVVLGIVASSLYMTFAKWLGSRDKEAGMDDAPPRSFKEIAGELIAIAIPITISSSILSLTGLIDSTLAVNRLSRCVDISYFNVLPDSAVTVALYGAYASKAVTFFNLPIHLVNPFAISIIPAINSASTEEEHEKVKLTMDFTFRTVSVICLPCAFGLGMLAKPIIDLLFDNHELYKNATGDIIFSNNAAAALLAILAPAVVFSGLNCVSTAILQAYGHERKSILSTCLGVGTKALTVWFLVGLPAVGHFGLPLSTLLCYLIMFTFNLFFLYRFVGYRFRFMKIIFKPFISAAACGCSALAAQKLLTSVTSPKIATVAAIAVAAMVYVVLLFLLRGLSKDDVLMLPKGKSLLKILTKFHLMKA